MKKEILFVLLKDFADWEGAYIAPNLNAGVEPGSESKYIVKTVSVRKEPVVSIGGFNTCIEVWSDISSFPIGKVF